LGSEDTKRLLLFFAIVFAIMMLWRPLFQKYAPQAPPAPQPAPAGSETQARSKPGTPTAAAGKSSGPSAASTQAAPAPALPSKPVQGSKAQDIVVENDLYRITFSTQGAVITSWVLKKFQDQNDKPLDVVNQPACAQLGFPMSVALPDTALTEKFNSALYAVEPGVRPGETLHAPAQLKFIFSDGKAEVQKTFTFGDTYQVDVQVSAVAGGSYLPVGVAWTGGFGDYSLGPSVVSSRSKAAYDAAGGLKTVAEKSVKASLSVPGPLTYAGLEDLYFVDIFLPGAPDDAFRASRPSWNPPHSTEKAPPAPFRAELATPAGRPLAFGLFIAPKSLDLLRSMKPPLDALIDFGWFGFIAKPLFLALRYIYDHWIHNYGWAIVILTVIINFALFPLKLKSIHSAQKMQKVAPIIKRIQDQYKQYKFNDPRKQKMNQEVMKVYSEHGINPLGGCLPMALQLPFLYGFYELLETVIELRHAPWLGCVKDLSQPDACHPFGIPVALLPTLMIISMFFMQKLTPMATADPAQQRMMYVMPLMFGIIFYRLASGLVLYYMAANVIGIAQQLIINRFIPAASPASANPPADKGSGRPESKGPRKGAGGARKPVSVKN
jgi:YidC/Oxa1 family membrane protein insertase